MVTSMGNSWPFLVRYWASKLNDPASLRVRQLASQRERGRSGLRSWMFRLSNSSRLYPRLWQAHLFA